MPRAANGDEIVAVFRERHEFTPGETITLAPQPAAVHLFDGETGAAAFHDVRQSTNRRRRWNSRDAT